jgi:hypothetical protein
MQMLHSGNSKSCVVQTQYKRQIKGISNMVE